MQRLEARCSRRRQCMFYSYHNGKLCTRQGPNRKEKTHSIGFNEEFRVLYPRCVVGVGAVW